MTALATPIGTDAALQALIDKMRAQAAPQNADLLASNMDDQTQAKILSRALVGASPAAQAIMGGGQLTPQEVSDLGPPIEPGPSGQDIVDKLNAAQPPGVQQAQTAIRSALASNPTGPVGSAGSLTQGEYEPLSTDAKAAITSWQGGAGTVPSGLEGKSLASTVTTNDASGVPQTQSVYADSSGNKFIMKNGNLVPAVSAADQAQSDIAQQNAAENLPGQVSAAKDQLKLLLGLPAQELGLRADQAQAAQQGLAGGNAAAVAKALADRMANARMLARGNQYVDPATALAENKQPGWNTGGRTIPQPSAETQAAAASYPAREAIREQLAAQSRAGLTQQGVADMIARKLRLQGPSYLAGEALSGQGGQGGYNPMLGAVWPGYESASQTGAYINSANARANADLADANTRKDEFGFATSPIGMYIREAQNNPNIPSFQDWVNQRGLQGAAGQQEQQQDLPRPVPATVVRNLQGKSPEQIADILASLNPRPNEFKEYAQRLVQSGLLTLPDIQTARYRALHPNEYAMTALGRFFSKNSTNALTDQTNAMRAKIYDALLSQMQSAPIPNP